MPQASPSPSPTPTGNVRSVSERRRTVPTPTPTPPTPQALPAREKERLDQALRAVLAYTAPESCNRQVIAKLSTLPGFNLEDFKAYLMRGTEFYDGTTSRVPIAGNIYAELAAKNVAKEAGLRENATVADYFNRGGTSQTNAWAGMNEQKLVVYFRPSAIGDDARRNFALVFHEALHGYGKSIGRESDYNDPKLLEVLDRRGDSIEITNDIKEHCPLPTPTPTPSPTPSMRK
jgi:hypothetical protein